MYLAKIDDVISFMDLSNTSEVQPKIAEYLVSASDALSSKLAHDFDLSTKTAIISVNSDDIREPKLKLRLDSGMVTDTALIFRISTDGAPLAHKDAGDVTVVPNFPDKEGGIVAFTDKSVLKVGEYVMSVTYEHGMTVKSKLYQNVPSWLERAAILQTVILMMTADVAFTKAKYAKYDLPELGRQLDKILEGHRRPRTWVLYPEIEV